MDIITPTDSSTLDAYDLNDEQVVRLEVPDSPLGYNISNVRSYSFLSWSVIGDFDSSAEVGVIAKFLGKDVSIWADALIYIVSNLVMMTSIGVL